MPSEQKTPRPYKDLGHQLADLRRQKGRRMGGRYTQGDVAEQVGVAEGTVTAWERGYRKPEGDNLIRLARVLEADHLLRWADAGMSEGGGTIREKAPGYLPDEDPEDLFGNAQAVTRFVEGVGRPGEAQLAKLDLLEGYRRMMTAAGKLPRWWYDVKEKVEAGEL